MQNLARARRNASLGPNPTSHTAIPDLFWTSRAKPTLLQARTTLFDLLRRRAWNLRCDTRLPGRSPHILVFSEHVPDRIQQVRIPSLVLLYDPAGHPRAQRWIHQHFHQRHGPTYFFATFSALLALPPVESTYQVRDSQEALAIRTTRNRERLHQLRTAKPFGIHCSQQIGIDSLLDHIMPFCRRHEPPKRYNLHSRIEFMTRMTGMSEICAASRTDHEAHLLLPADQLVTRPEILVIKLIQRRVPRFTFEPGQALDLPLLVTRELLAKHGFTIIKLTNFTIMHDIRICARILTQLLGDFG